MSEELKPDTIDDEFRREMTKLMLERYNIQFEMELNEYRKNRIIYKALGFEKARAVVKQYNENEKKFLQIIAMFENYFKGKSLIYTSDYNEFSIWFYKHYCFSVNNDKLFELEDITENHFKLFHEYKERMFNGGWSDEDERRYLKETFTSEIVKERLKVKKFIENQFYDWDSIFIRESDYTQFITILTAFFNGETYTFPQSKFETKSGTINKTAFIIRRCRDKFQSSTPLTRNVKLFDMMRCLKMFDDISEGEYGRKHRLYKELTKKEEKGKQKVYY